MTPRPPNADRFVVVVSDIEVGAGGATDDFPQSAALGRVLLDYRRDCELPIDFVFNGDTFDFLKTRVSGSWPVHVTANLAVAKLLNIQRAHPEFFSALATLAQSPDTRLHFVVGNHDPELVFPAVQSALRRMLNPSQGALHFPGFSLRLGDIHIEHGSQADPMFRVDPQAPFSTRKGRPVLALPWGSVAILEVAMPMQPVLYHFDRIKPRDQLLERIPELKELLTSAYYKYWREQGTGWLRGEDPIKHLSWTAFKEIVYRFSSGDMNVNGTGHLRKVVESGPIRVAIGGHLHCPAWWTNADRKVLITGCWRNEFVMDGEHFRTLPKVHAEAWTQGERTLTAQLVEFTAPQVPVGYVPPVYRDLEGLRQMLAKGDLAGITRSWAKSE